MILERILAFFGLKEKRKMENVEIFQSVPEIMAFFQKNYPEAKIERSKENSEELGIFIQKNEIEKTFIPIRDSPKSGYFLIEIPKDL